MSCKHTEFQDLVTHWQCKGCGRIVEKLTNEETLDRVDAITDELHQLELQGVYIEHLANRIDNVRTNLLNSKSKKSGLN